MSELAHAVPERPLVRIRRPWGDWETAELWGQRSASAAREELVRRHLPLARQLAKRYHSQNEPFEDLVQVASVGLMLAITRFDPERGAGFRSYAIPTILGELKRHFRDTGWAVHIPRETKERAMRIEQAARQLTDELGRSPRIDELAARMNLSTERVLDGLEAAHAHHGSSLDRPSVGEDPGDAPPLVETLGHEDDGYDLVDANLEIADGLRRLPFMERSALVLRVRHDLTQVEIARRLGCSQMQVSRLLAAATARLRPAV